MIQFMKSRALVYTCNYVIFPKIAEKVEKKNKKPSGDGAVVEGGGRQWKTARKRWFPIVQKNTFCLCFTGRPRDRETETTQSHTDTQTHRLGAFCTPYPVSPRFCCQQQANSPPRKASISVHQGRVLIILLLFAETRATSENDAGHSDTDGKKKQK